MKKLLLMGTCILVLTACKEAEYIDRTGKVIDKEYTPRKTETYTETQFTGKTLIPVVRTRVKPEKYILKVSYTVEKEKELEVSKEEYEKAIIGNDINFKELE